MQIIQSHGQSRRIQTRPCEFCGNAFEFTHDNRRRKYCHGCSAFGSTVLGASSPVPWASCVGCHATFLARGRKRIHCQPRKEYGSYYRPIPKQTICCAECGASFVGHPHRRYCCRQHAKTAANRTRRHVERVAGKRRAGQQRRAQRMRTQRVGPTFTLLEVAVRDGWKCHLCSKRVSRADASIDHLVPLSHGGEHGLLNVALAHRLCNSLRSDVGAAQLRLIA